MIGSTVSTDRPVYLRLLGAAHVEGFAPGELPGRSLELLTYLHLNPAGVAGVQVQHALWPDAYVPSNGHARTLAKQTRSVLGHAPDGRRWFPEATKAGYALHPALASDWSDFQRLMGPDPSHTPTAALIDAVRLVRGQPLDGITRRPGWWTWRGPFEEAMIAGVLAAASEMYTRAMGAGRLSDARTAATIARSTDPLNETGWRMELRLAMLRADPITYAQTVADLYATVGTAHPLDTETAQLLAHAPAALRAAAPHRP